MNDFLKFMLVVGLIMVIAGSSCTPGCFFVGHGHGHFYRRRYRSRGWFTFGRRRGFAGRRRWGK